MIRTNDPEYENPPFAPDHHCEACGVPWRLHDGTTTVCRKLQEQCELFNLLTKQHLDLMDAFKAYKSKFPETPISTDPQISPLPDAPEDDL